MSTEQHATNLTCACILENDQWSRGGTTAAQGNQSMLCLRMCNHLWAKQAHLEVHVPGQFSKDSVPSVIQPMISSVEISAMLHLCPLDARGERCLHAWYTPHGPHTRYECFCNGPHQGHVGSCWRLSRIAEISSPMRAQKGQETS